MNEELTSEITDEHPLRKSSILKLPKPRIPLQNLRSNEEDLRQRRVSFAGVNQIKEFNTKAESVLICDTPAYEEEFSSSSESSQSYIRSGICTSTLGPPSPILVTSSPVNICNDYAENIPPKDIDHILKIDHPNSYLCKDTLLQEFQNNECLDMSLTEYTGIPSKENNMNMITTNVLNLVKSTVNSEASKSLSDVNDFNRTVFFNTSTEITEHIPSVSILKCKNYQYFDDNDIRKAKRNRSSITNTSMELNKILPRHSALEGILSDSLMELTIQSSPAHKKTRLSVESDDSPCTNHNPIVLGNRTCKDQIDSNSSNSPKESDEIKESPKVVSQVEGLTCENDEAQLSDKMEETMTMEGAIDVLRSSFNRDTVTDIVRHIQLEEEKCPTPPELSQLNFLRDTILKESTMVSDSSIDIAKGEFYNNCLSLAGKTSRKDEGCENSNLDITCVDNQGMEIRPVEFNLSEFQRPDETVSHSIPLVSEQIVDIKQPSVTPGLVSILPCDSIYEDQTNFKSDMSVMCEGATSGVGSNSLSLEVALSVKSEEQVYKSCPKKKEYDISELNLRKSVGPIESNSIIESSFTLNPRSILEDSGQVPCNLSELKALNEFLNETPLKETSIASFCKSSTKKPLDNLLDTIPVFPHYVSTSGQEIDTISENNRKEVTDEVDQSRQQDVQLTFTSEISMPAIDCINFENSVTVGNESIMCSTKCLSLNVAPVEMDISEAFIQGPLSTCDVDPEFENVEKNDILLAKDMSVSIVESADKSALESVDKNYLESAEKGPLEFANKHAVEFAVESSLEYADKCTVKSANKSTLEFADKSAMESANKNAVDYADKSALKSADKCAMESADKSTVKFSNKSALASADKSAMESSDKSALKSADKSALKSADKSAMGSAYKSTVEFANKCALEPADKSAMESADESTVEFANKCAMESADKSTVEFVDKCDLESADKSTVEFVDKCALESADKSTVEFVDKCGLESADKGTLEYSNKRALESANSHTVEFADKSTLESTKKSALGIADKSSSTKGVKVLMETMEESAADSEETISDNIRDSEHLSDNVMNSDPLSDNAMDSEPLSDNAMDSEPLSYNVMDSEHLSDNVVDSKPMTEVMNSEPLSDNVMDTKPLSDPSSSEYHDGNVADFIGPRESFQTAAVPKKYSGINSATLPNKKETSGGSNVVTSTLKEYKEVYMQHRTTNSTFVGLRKLSIEENGVYYDYGSTFKGRKSYFLPGNSRQSFLSPMETKKSVEYHIRDFMEDVLFNYVSWTEWVRRYFKNSLEFFVEVPLEFVDNHTCVKNSLLDLNPNIKDPVLLILAPQLLEQLNKGGLLGKLKILQDLNNVSVLIEKEVAKVTEMYNDIKYFMKMCPVQISTNNEFYFSVVKFEKIPEGMRTTPFHYNPLYFDVLIKINDYNKISSDDIRIVNVVGKVCENQVKRIFCNIPTGNTRLYEYYWALHELCTNVEEFL